LNRLPRSVNVSVTKIWFLHLWWNLSNETVLGNVYGWEPGLFSGKFWIFKGEGLFGLLIMTPIAAWILWQMQREETSATAGRKKRETGTSRNSV
jgi:hypothetical protein